MRRRLSGSFEAVGRQQMIAASIRGVSFDDLVRFRACEHLGRIPPEGVAALA
jgi:hypothetical protein